MTRSIPLLILALALGLALVGPARSAAPSLQATLVDATELAQKGGAKVEVEVTGLELVDPASVQERPRPGQGHLHYRVDDGPVIATTVTKLSFHELTPGAHTFEVSLVGNDHQPLGPSETLRVSVPLAPAAHRHAP